MSVLRDLLTEALGDRYTLERELGRGGMAVIYLAHDTRDQRPVAIKVMQPGLVNALGTGRFLREIEVAASLSHPLIVPLYHSGNAGDMLYYVMPYIEGESLYQRLKRERQLSLDDALRITHDAAEALGYAHSRGVVHRDVKPENILLADGRALIADFGLARVIGAADYEKLTATGVMIGTVYYMSPQQLTGDSSLDQRADIYSLGCILYEMLTGEVPYSGLSFSQVVSRILGTPAPSARRLQAAVPPEVDGAIIKALAKSAGDRFGSMQEFVTALAGR